MTLTEDLSYCIDQLRRLDHDRYLITLLAPEQTRASLVALYAFNLEIARTAESVSEPMLGHIRLQWWREAIEGIYSGTPRRHAVIQPLVKAVQALNLRREDFEALIDARDADLEPEPFNERDALLSYAETTGGLLEDMAARIAVPDEKEAWLLARKVGRAWAIVGLMRSIPFLYSQGRVMLPQSELAAAGLTRENLAVWEQAGTKGRQALREIVKSYLALAGADLRLARCGGKQLSRRAKQQLLLARIADLHILRFARRGYDPFDAKLQINPPSRAWRLLSARLMNRF